MSARSVPQPPVVFVHAITGAVLRDAYRLPPEVVWDPGVSLFHWRGIKEFSRLAVHPDDLRYDAEEPARVVASHAVQIVYGELLDALRDGLSAKADRPVPVFPFAYDWRLDNLTTAARLGEFIHEVIERTNLVRHYAGGCDCVDLVGHSMGGLVIAACLAKGHHVKAGRSRVRRVVTLGTPFRGALDALVKMSTGESELVGEPRHPERTLARMTPALYQLLPFYDGALQLPAETARRAARRTRANAKAVFDAANWQTSIVDSLAESIRLYRVTGAAGSAASRMDDATTFLARRLAEARSFFELVNSLAPREALSERGGGAHDGWLLLVGLDEKTHVRARVERDGKQSRFVFDKDGNGDGVVPIEGAVPDWAERDRVVAVKGEDFGGFLGFGENWPKRKLVSLHVALPLMNLAHRWIVSFLRGKRWGDLWGRPLPDVDVKRWRSPVPGAVVRA